MTTTAPFRGALPTAGRLARALADPSTAWPGGRPEGVRAWPQSLAGGASGIALLHIERARTGRADWDTAHTWLAAAVHGEVSAAANANLYFGAPALAFITHRAATASSRYLRVLERLDAATLTVTRNRLGEVRQRSAPAAPPHPAGTPSSPWHEHPGDPPHDVTHLVPGQRRVP